MKLVCALFVLSVPLFVVCFFPLLFRFVPRRFFFTLVYIYRYTATSIFFPFVCMYVSVSPQFGKTKKALSFDWLPAPGHGFLFSSLLSLSLSLPPYLAALSPSLVFFCSSALFPALSIISRASRLRLRRRGYIPY